VITVTEGCSAVDVVFPSIVPSVIVDFSRVYSLSASKDIEAGLLTRIYGQSRKQSGGENSLIVKPAF